MFQVGAAVPADLRVPGQYENDSFDVEVVENGYILSVHRLQSVVRDMTLPQRDVSARVASAMTASEFSVDDMEVMSPLMRKTTTYVAHNMQELLYLIEEHAPVSAEEKKEAEAESEAEVAEDEEPPSPERPSNKPYRRPLSLQPPSGLVDKY